MSLTKKIDFALILKVTNANPNGDRLNGNRPRADFQGFGEMTDVCLKRKIRDRLQDSGESIFVQSDEKKTDGMTSLANRAKDKDVGLGADAFNAKKANKDDTAKKACEKWLDVRSFGQVFAFSGDGSSGISIAVRGPVTIQSAFSVEPINITSTQITKSVSGEGDGMKKSSDTMGMKHRIDHGVYVAFGAMSPQLAERTGFSDDDAEKIKAFLWERGIASCPTVFKAIRMHGNASDEFLHVVESVDLPAVLAQMPQVSRIGTTGGKATEILIGKLPQKTKLPKTGETVPYPCGERSLQLTRLPSTSRAYPLALAKKAEAYHAFFHAAGLV